MCFNNDYSNMGIPLLKAEPEPRRRERRMNFSY